MSLKLFGKQKPKKDYDLTIETQNKIMEYYKNRRFRKAAVRFMKLSPQLKQENAEVYIL